MVLTESYLGYGAESLVLGPASLPNLTTSIQSRSHDTRRELIPSQKLPSESTFVLLQVLTILETKIHEYKEIKHCLNVEPEESYKGQAKS